MIVDARIPAPSSASGCAGRWRTTSCSRWCRRTTARPWWTPSTAGPSVPATACSCRPGRRTSSGQGVLVVEVQEPTDLSILLEWDGFAVDGDAEGHLGVGFPTAVTAVDTRVWSESDVEACARAAAPGRRRARPCPRRGTRTRTSAPTGSPRPGRRWPCRRLRRARGARGRRADRTAPPGSSTCGRGDASSSRTARRGLAADRQASRGRAVPAAGSRTRRRFGDGTRDQRGGAARPGRTADRRRGDRGRPAGGQPCPGRPHTRVGRRPRPVLPRAARRRGARGAGPRGRRAGGGRDETRRVGPMGRRRGLVDDRRDGGRLAVPATWTACACRLVGRAAGRYAFHAQGGTLGVPDFAYAGGRWPSGWCSRIRPENSAGCAGRKTQAYPPGLPARPRRGAVGGLVPDRHRP